MPPGQRLHGTYIKSQQTSCATTRTEFWVTRKVPVIIGSLGEAYVLVEPEVGNIFHAAGSVASAPASASASPSSKSTNVGDR